MQRRKKKNGSYDSTVSLADVKKMKMERGIASGVGKVDRNTMGCSQESNETCAENVPRQWCYVSALPLYTRKRADHGCLELQENTFAVCNK